MKTAQLTVTIRYNGDCQDQDVREALGAGTTTLHEQGLLTPVHDCELEGWVWRVAFGDAPPDMRQFMERLGRMTVYRARDFDSLEKANDAMETMNALIREARQLLKGRR